MVEAQENTVQNIEIDFDALDASYIEGTEFVFWGTLKWLDPFQPQLTPEDREAIVGGECGEAWPLKKVDKRLAEYWVADDPTITQEMQNDALEALKSLDWKVAKARAAIKAAVNSGVPQTLEQLIYHALRGTK